MRVRDLKDMVKGRVHFVEAKEGSLWYATDCGFDFPVPYADTEGAVFLHEDKAFIFMRWIRKERERVLKREAEVEAARKVWDEEQQGT